MAEAEQRIDSLKILIAEVLSLGLGQTMSDKKPCPDCEATREVELVEYSGHVTFGGREVCYDAQSYQCQHCGCKFDTAETMDRNLATIRRVK